MKRFAIVLSVIILLAMLSSSFPVLGQPTHIPHQNPVAAKDSPGLVSLLSFYGNVFDLAAISQYQDAQSMLDELEYANIPDELRYLIDRYSTLSRQLLTTLDNLETMLDEASNMLANYQISGVKQKLDDIEATIHSAELLLKDVEAATTALGHRLGVFLALPGSEIRLAYDRLEQILYQLGQLTARLNQLRQRLDEEYKSQAVELIPTKLSLIVTPVPVFVGDNITASGRLIGDNSPLAERKLTLFLDSEPLTITTDLDGSYTSNITIPYKYVPDMTLTAEYVPSGDDIGIYQGCKKSCPVPVMFYFTLLEVSVPETAHPGLPITISGQVSSTDSAVDRTAEVLLDNSQLAQETIQGQFSIQITAPQQVSVGEHSLTVVVTPQERYSGTSKRLTIDISRLPIGANIQVPRLSVIPKLIQISGKVYHNLDPVQDARVSFSFRDSLATVKTSTDGSFTTAIEVPLDLSLVGSQELTVTIEPAEAWYASLQTKRWIFMINPANIGLMLVAFISLGLLVFTRVRARPVRPQEEAVIPEVKIREPSAGALLPRPRYEFSGIRGRILSAYLDGLETVERVTSIPMVPQATLREFLSAVTPRLLTAIKPFTELTIAAEIALYSARKLDENTAAIAEQLAATIKEELHSGTT